MAAAYNSPRQQWFAFSRPTKTETISASLPPLQASLLETVREYPEDDAPRLVYADWLEEQGHPRAEFIRLQCQLAHLRENDPCYSSLREREVELSLEYEDGWTQPWRKFVRRHLFQRGFAEWVSMTARNFRKAGLRLLHHEPVQDLRLTNLETQGYELGQCPSFEKVRGLDLSGLILPAADFCAWLRSPYLRGLRTLNLQALIPRLPLKSIRRLASADLPHLRTLNLGEHILSLSAWESLARAPFPSLQRLHLADCRLRSTNLPVVLQGSYIPRLRFLDLSSNFLGDQGLSSFRGAAFAQLRELRLSYNYIRAQGVRHLCETPGLDQLTHLRLDTNDLNDAGVQHLLNAPFASTLEELHLSYNELTDRSILRLASSPAFSRLQVLNLSGNLLTERSALALAQSPYLPSLRSLILTHTSHTFTPETKRSLLARYPESQFIDITQDSLY